MKLTTKQLLIIAGVVLVIFIVIGVWFYRKGKRKVTIQPPPLDDPGSGTVASGVSNAEILSISGALHKDMDGFNYAGHDVEPYQRLNALSDTDFVKVYNVFNAAYQPDSGETLKQWIETASQQGWNACT
jgi:hypothetical protein